MKRMEVTKNGCSTAQLQEAVQTSTPRDSTEAFVGKTVCAHDLKNCGTFEKGTCLTLSIIREGSFAQASKGRRKVHPY